ncbi:MAG: hydrogenase 4 subunit F, partial [Candidatus Uhrbacteria bacterium]|nr:hydrogenase 4 subunit F [Candidatus Uhrbacteria bacterium]
MLFLILLITPLFAAFVSALVQAKRTVIEGVTLMAVLVEAVVFIRLVMGVLEHGTVEYFGHFSLNALSALFGLVVVMVGCVAALYSVGYLREETRRGIIGMRRIRQFYTLFNVFLFSMLAAVILVNPILMWIAVEATTLSTVFLISFYGKKNSIEAAWKFLIINSIALLLGFLGTLLFVGMPTHFGGTWSFVDGAQLDPALLKIAFVFVLIGYGTKT